MNNDARPKASPKWFWLALLLALAATVIFYPRKREDTLGPVFTTKAQYHGQSYNLLAAGLGPEESSFSPHVVLWTGARSCGFYSKGSTLFYRAAPENSNTGVLPQLDFRVTSTLSIFDGKNLHTATTSLHPSELAAAIRAGKPLE